ncbi:site-2 protease family protein [Maridesulfovibrio sp.]|uniref:site-2 protease family protein n=1 Tax=Maridesulfovibrio sp. TaxID=2795000 RepID=UPI002A18B7D9|nr:site-2 protease family protein [Maridesulfovibrio sp.]
MQLSCGTQNEKDESGPLPRLRPDLEIVVSPSGIDGAPTYTIYDPVARRFSKVGWAEAAILEQLRHPCTLDSLKEQLQSTTIRLSDKELAAFIRKADLAGLTTSSLIMPVETLMARSAASRPGLFNWLLKNYLYIRIPLLRPDRFLSESLGTARLLISKPALLLYLLLGLAGLAGLIQNFASYLNTFPYFFNLNGMLCYGFSIVILKAIHEFSHAYTAKNFGIRVPVMGIAFIVMWPVAFCDVTDGWKLRDRNQRAKIALAGIGAELVIAGLALFGWSISSPGVFNSICFVVSSTSLLSTLMVNLNPAMSFDGYFIFMDIWGVDNLRPRSFAVTRWFYRKYLFGIEWECPEKYLKPKRLWAFLIYSVYSWLYRLVLYFGIAVLMYYKFTKTLGLFLFGVEVWWFIVKPLGMEMKNIIKNKSSMQLTRPGMIILGFAAVFLLWAAVPMKRTLEAPAVVIAEEMQVVHAPSAGQLLEVNVDKGDFVSKGQVLAVIQSRKLDTAIFEIRSQLDVLLIERANLELNEEFRPLLPQKEEEITQTKSRLEGLEKEKNEQRVKARLSGQVLWWNEQLRKGGYIGKDISMGRIVGSERLIRAFVEEDRLSSVQAGDDAKFYPASAAGSFPGRVMNISPARSEHVDHIALTSLSQGMIPVAPDESGRMSMVDSYYAVEIRPDAECPVAVGQSGTVRLNTRPESLLLNWLRKGYRGLLRESGF